MKKSTNRVIVQTMLTGTMTQAQAATHFGISTRWIRELMRRYHAGGLDAVDPQPRTPKTSPTAAPEAVTDRIIELRDQLTTHGHDSGADTIAWYLPQEGPSSPAASTIHRILKQAGRITPEPHKRPRSSWIRFEAELPNQTWQMDYSRWKLADGTRANIMTILDDHSRFVVSCTAHLAATTEVIMDRFLTAGNNHGFPQSTLTDNGSAFTAKLVHGRNNFELLLDRLGVQQKNGHPNHPQTQGKVERFHQTLKKALAARP